MKLKDINKLFLTVALGAFAAMWSTSCSDDDVVKKLHGQAEILPANFTVEGTGMTKPDKPAPLFRGVFAEDGETILIRLPEEYDPEVELKGVTPRFFLSMGATVSPLMNEPQDFSDPNNPVVYTVTSFDGAATRKYKVSFTIVPPTNVEKGKGFTAGELTACKTFAEMGYPGEFFSFPAFDGPDKDKVSVLWGDLMGFPAFCGKDKVVMFSRRYAWGDDGKNGADLAMAANPDLAFMVYNLPDLSPAGKLNLGSIAAKDVVAIASDWVGNMVAAVGRKSSGKTDFYYWTSTDAAPVHFGSSDVCIDISKSDSDGAPYINIAGDVTGKAVITAAAPQSNTGEHYKFSVAGGRMISGYEIISTGHPSNDKNSFQMISYFGPNPSDPYLVGDTQQNGSEPNGHIHVYLNNPDGTNRGDMDYHCVDINGWKMDDGLTWWSRSGSWLERDGGRRPTVHAMVINGVQYSYFTTGYDYRNRGCLMDLELTTGIEIKDGETVVTKNPYPHFCYGVTTAAKSPLSDGGMWLPYSFGAIADWMYDEEEMVGYVAFWGDRFGMHLFRLTCFEF